MESRSSLAGQMARLTGFENQLMYQGGHTMGPILGVNQRIPIYVYCIRVILSDLLNSTLKKKKHSMGWKCEVQDIFCKQHYFSFIGKLVEGSVFSVFFFLWKHIPSLTKNLNISPKN